MGVRHPGLSTDSRRNRGHRGVDGGAHGGGRGARASLRPLGCERERRRPAPAGFPLRRQVHCMLCTWRMRCTWMSRHCSSLRGDKGSSDAQPCLCTKARGRRSSPARASEGVLRGLGGRSWGAHGCSKAGGSCSSPGSTEGPVREGTSWECFLGVHITRKGGLWLQAQKATGAERGGYCSRGPGARPQRATREPHRHAHKVTTTGEVAH